MERAEKLQSEPNMRAGQNAGTFAKPLLVCASKLVLRDLTRRHEPRDHARTLDRGRERPGLLQLWKGGPKGCFVLAEFHWQVDHGRSDFEFVEQTARFRNAGAHGRIQLYVHSSKSNASGQLSEFRPRNA